MVLKAKILDNLVAVIWRSKVKDLAHCRGANSFNASQLTFACQSSMGSRFLLYPSAESMSFPPSEKEIKIVR